MATFDGTSYGSSCPAVAAHSTLIRRQAGPSRDVMGQTTEKTGAPGQGKVSKAVSGFFQDSGNPLILPFWAGSLGLKGVVATFGFAKKKWEKLAFKGRDEVVVDAVEQEILPKAKRIADKIDAKGFAQLSPKEKAWAIEIQEQSGGSFTEGNLVPKLEKMIYEAKEELKKPKKERDLNAIKDLVTDEPVGFGAYNKVTKDGLIMKALKVIGKFFLVVAAIVAELAVVLFTLLGLLFTGALSLAGGILRFSGFVCEKSGGAISRLGHFLTVGHDRRPRDPSNRFDKVNGPFQRGAEVEMDGRSEDADSDRMQSLNPAPFDGPGEGCFTGSVGQDGGRPLQSDSFPSSHPRVGSTLGKLGKHKPRRPGEGSPKTRTLGNDGEGAIK